MFRKIYFLLTPLGHLHFILSFRPPKIFPPLRQVAIQVLNPLELSEHEKFTLESVDDGLSGVHPWHSDSDCFQKNPSFRLHRQRIRLLPIPTLPASQICIHVEPSHETLETPDGYGSSDGQSCQSAAAFTPTGNPHPD